MRLLILSFILLLFTVDSTAQSSTDPAQLARCTARLDSALQSLPQRHHLVGAGIAVFTDQEIVFQRDYGYADLAARRPIDSATIFRIGSISKVFTALAVLRLWEEGRLDLDAPVERYLPGLRWTYAHTGPRITTRHLLTHTAGLGDDIGRGFYAAAPEPQSALIDYLQYEVLTLPPGLKHNYSNIGYGLLGALIEAVSGESYATYVGRTVLAPLGLTSTSCGPPAHTGHRVHGYRADSTVLDEYPLRDVAAGGIESTRGDVVRLGQLLLGQARGVGANPVLAPATFREMLRNQLDGVALNIDDQFGLGVFIQPLGTQSDSLIGPGIGHAGDLRMHHAILMVYPALNLGIVTLTNSERGASFANAASIRVMREYLRATRGIALQGASPAAYPAGFRADRIDHRRLAGIYGGGGTGMIRLKKSGRKKLIFHQDGNVLALKRQADNTYKVRYRLLKVLPIPVKAMALAFREHDGRLYMMLLDPKSKSAQFISMRDPGPAPGPEWQRMAGDYEAVNAPADEPNLVPFRLTCDNQKLVLHRRLGGSSDPNDADSIGFYVVDAATATEDGIERGAGATMRILANGNLYYSGYELKKKGEVGRRD